MTATRIDILAISGSLRTNSDNTMLLRSAAELAGPHTRLGLWPGLAAIPPFSEDEESEPIAAVEAMREAIAAADALLFATPEYNASVPGQLKNALDWASRPYGDSVLSGKLVAVIGASPGDYGAAWAQTELRKVLETCGARVLARELAVGKSDQAFGKDARLRDPRHRQELESLVRDLEEAACRMPVAA